VHTLLNFAAGDQMVLGIKCWLRVMTSMGCHMELMGIFFSHCLKLLMSFRNLFVVSYLPQENFLTQLLE